MIWMASATYKVQCTTISRIFGEMSTFLLVNDILTAGKRLLRDWILLVCFSWREARYEIYKWTLCRFIPPWETRIQSLYLYFNFFIKIVPLWLRNIRFLIQNARSLFYGRHYSSLHRLMSLHRKLNVKIFLMFIVAENTGSVNICKWRETGLTSFLQGNTQTWIQYFSSLCVCVWQGGIPGT